MAALKLLKTVLQLQCFFGERMSDLALKVNQFTLYD